MTHIELISLIAKVDRWYSWNEVKEGFDVNNPDTVRLGYVDEQTIILDGEEIIVFGTDGREHQFVIGNCISIG